MNPEQCRFPAPAKLNLFLHVVGRRPDGYHLLQTVFRFLDVGDWLEITPRADGRIRLLSPLPGLDPEQDLCWRAARLLQEYGGCRQGADIRLDKRLPMGGGLGGGSSDAATVLLALNRLWRLDLPRRDLRELGLRLGADVPVFVFGRSAFAEGVGEVLTPWMPAPASYVVLTPDVQVSTAAIFAHPALTRDTPSIKITALSHGFGHNDLEPIVCALYPQVVEALDWLKTHGEARMTGSGACVFAAFPARARAERVFAERPGHLRGFVADGIDQHPLLGWAD
ncbi:MAG TPA: 4-(cytidine 5'-diphospho)-2-C-methyl-D-erythritol kinase [Thiobacillaceae bacterium]|nr:4-(cytidine 5'-diphospho)-2-C-methyl-D-erythritol kinase [Thiobacillaceae bacterium]HNU64775.1 4-(cytidine 5'-diphospho)-2-C-methyl-D-erythritol kinase [Thiobacillaceae bacterium]